MALLEIQDISKSFGGLQALDRVSLGADEGQVTGLIGPNGAGKTTLFNIITRIDRQTGGHVFFRGKQVDDLPAHEVVRQGIARTFQNLRLFKEMTVLENVMVGGHTRTQTSIAGIVCRAPSARLQESGIRKSAMEALEFVNLASCAGRLAGSLPHGQQRLVDLARALVSDPRLLLLDEPSAGLNPREKDVLHEVFRSILTRGISIFIVEHDMRTIMSISSKVVVLEYGRKIAEGAPQMICKDPTVIRAYLGKEYDIASA